MGQHILGIDIGSSKICAVIADVKEDNTPHIIGMGSQRSQGVKKGLIVNIELASRAIKSAINDARRMAESEALNKAIVCVSGAYTRSVCSSGVYNITEGEITIKEIGKAIANAVYNAYIPQEFETIHVLPYRFKLDEQDYIQDPMGMTGRRLEVFVHIVTAQRSSLENLKKTIHLAGVEIENFVLSAYAASISVLSDDEKELGVACIDMGGSTCEIMIHDGNAMRYNDFVGVGSNHITLDLAMALNTKIPAAEEVKITYGNLVTNEEDRRIEVPSVGVDEAVHFVALNEAQKVMIMRVAETFKVLNSKIELSGLKDRLGAGVVFTSGMMQMEGIREFASNVFFQKMPTRISKPVEMMGLFDELRNPAYATVLGLIWYGAGKYTNYEKDSMGNICCKESKRMEESPSIPSFHPKGGYGQDYGNVNIRSTDLTDLKEDLLEDKERRNMEQQYRMQKKGGFWEKAKNSVTAFADRLF